MESRKTGPDAQTPRNFCPYNTRLKPNLPTELQPKVVQQLNGVKFNNGGPIKVSMAMTPAPATSGRIGDQGGLGGGGVRPGSDGRGGHQDGSGRVAGIGNSRPLHWICRNCGYKNFTWRQECKKCQTCSSAEEIEFGGATGQREGGYGEDDQGGGFSDTSKDRGREGVCGNRGGDGESLREGRDEPDKRLDLANIGLKLEDYLRNKVPQETKKSTEQAVRLYDRVMSSAAKQQGKEFKTLKDTPVIEIPDALGRFLIIARKQNGEVFNASSLETFYQSLARYLATDYEPKIDIKKDVKFKIVQQILERRCTEVAEQGGRPGKNASRAVSAETMKLAYQKGTLGRKTPKALVTTVHSVMMSGFGCRAIKEVYSVHNEDIIIGPEEQHGLPRWIELSERITKTRRGRKNQVRDVEGKVYLDNEHPEICPVRTLLEFKRRKTEDQNAPDKPFLLTVKQSAQSNPEREQFWYTKSRMGENQIAKLFTEAFSEAGVDVKAEKIKATSCRKNLVQAGADALVPGGFLSKMVGQKNLDSKLHYLVNKDKSHQAASLVIQREAAGVSGPTFPEVFHQLQNSGGLKNSMKKFSDEEIKKSRNPSEISTDDDMGTTLSQSHVLSLKRGTLRSESKVSFEESKKMKYDSNQNFSYSVQQTVQTNPTMILGGQLGLQQQSSQLLQQQQYPLLHHQLQSPFPLQQPHLLHQPQQPPLLQQQQSPFLYQQQQPPLLYQQHQPALFLQQQQLLQQNAFMQQQQQISLQYGFMNNLPDQMIHPQLRANNPYQLGRLSSFSPPQGLPPHDQQLQLQHQILLQQQQLNLLMTQQQQQTQHPPAYVPLVDVQDKPSGDKTASKFRLLENNNVVNKHPAEYPTVSMAPPVTGSKEKDSPESPNIAFDSTIDGDDEAEKENVNPKKKAVKEAPNQKPTKIPNSVSLKLGDKGIQIAKGFR